MATATAAREEQYVSQPTKTTLFMCRRSDLRLVKDPRYPRYGAAGQKVGEFPGAAVQFRDGRLDVPASGKMMLDDGREADAAEVREWLLSHPLIDNTQEGMWVVDQLAPPVSQEEISTLLRISMDEDALRAIISQEESGWARPALLEPAGEALERLLEITAQMQAEAEARAEEDRKAEAARKAEEKRKAAEAKQQAGGK